MAAVKYLDENGLSTVWSKVKGIVTPKADKVSGATAGHLAGLNSSGNLTDSGLVATNVAQKDGSYSGMTVGAAEDLVSAESVASEFTSRITGGSTAVGKGGTALVDKIKGRTLVWNQLENGTWTSDFTVVKSGNTYTLSGTTNDVLTMFYSKSFISGHKYLVKAHLKINRETSLSGNFYPGYFSSPTQWIGHAITGEGLRSGIDFKNIITADSNKSRLYMGAYHQGTTSKFSASDTVVVSNPQVYDLTLMFGAGNEPATPEEFEAMYPGPYYDYNAGTLISNAATAIETVGWNAFDNSTLQLGKYRNVSNTETTIAGRRCSDEYFPCIGGANYNLVTDSTLDSTFIIVVCWYDSAKQFISGYNCNRAVLSFPSNAAYFRISSAEATGNICISLSDPSRNGTYEPYWRSELELGLGDIKVKSHNLWDEQWEAGGIDATTGQNDSTSNIIRAKNYTPVTGGQSYYIYMGSARASQAISMRYYDANKNLIGTTDKNGSSNGANLVRVMPDSCAYIRFVTSSYYGSSTTYLNDICINLSDPAFNGRYEPYGDGGVISITGGLKSAGAVYDEISGGKFIKRLESVDLGIPTYSTSSTDSGTVFVAYISGMNSPSTESGRIDGIINPKYVVTDSSHVYYANMPDKTSMRYNGSIVIKDSAYTDAATFKAAMSGVPLYYDLAQPIEYELAEAIPTAMRNDPYGTERRLPEDTAAIVTAPFRADITYSTNIKEAVQSLPQNYININSMQDFLAALGAQMGGTWTMRPADGKFDFTFTPNPVEPTL